MAVPSQKSRGVPELTKVSTTAGPDGFRHTPHVHQASRVGGCAKLSEDQSSHSLRVGVAAACAMNSCMFLRAPPRRRLPGMSTEFQTFFRWLSPLVAIPVMTFSARPFFQTGIAGLRAGIIHIDLSIALALAIASLASVQRRHRHRTLWFDSLAMLTTALLGRGNCSGARSAPPSSADSLRGVAFPEFARRVDGDDTDAASVEVPLSALVPGDRVEVRSGELRRSTASS